MDPAVFPRNGIPRTMDCGSGREHLDDEVNAILLLRCSRLAAKGPEKERAKEHIVRIASHILDNGWVLRDMDGKPTRWGRWDPAYLLTPYGFEARGLNGMEAQTYMITAHALSQDAKFSAGLEQLLEWRYHKYTVRQNSRFRPMLFARDEIRFPVLHPLYVREGSRSAFGINLRSPTQLEVIGCSTCPFNTLRRPHRERLRRQQRPPSTCANGPWTR